MNFLQKESCIIPLPNENGMVAFVQYSQTYKQIKLHFV